MSLSDRPEHLCRDDRHAQARVAVVRHNLFVPSETFIRAQAGALRRYQPIYVARRQAYNIPAGVEVVTTRDQGSFIEDIFYSATARSRVMPGILRNQGIDVAHAHFGPDGLYAAHAARRANIPLIVTFHGRDITVRGRDLLRTRRPVSANYALRRLALARYADRLLFVSDRLREDAIQLGFPADRLTTHYIGVDTELYYERTAEREPIIVHIARLVEKKGTAYLIDAFSKIAHRHLDVRLVIVGDGPLGQQLRDKAAASSAATQIDFLGQRSVEEVRDLVGRSSVLAAPSVTAENGDREGLPIALIEAMSLGTPVVATRHSGIPEAISSDDVGLLVDERDVDALSDRLSELLENPNIARKIGASASALVREKFNLSTQTAHLEDIYDSVR